jgi:heme-degrading monooxygenase HmoA
MERKGAYTRPMIARTWRGWTRREDADAYLEYVRETGLNAYRATPGNCGAWALQRDEGDRTEIITLSFWDSLDAVRAFAGEDVEQAVFYPEDDRFLVERELRVRHYRLEE